MRGRSRRPVRKFNRKKYVTKSMMYKTLDRVIENKINTEALTVHFGSITNSWSEVDYSAIPAGSGTGSRVGNRITIKSIEIKGVICQGSNELATDDSYNVVRIIVALWDGRNSTPLATAANTINDVIRNTYLTPGLIKKYYDKYIALTVTSTEQGEGDGYTPMVKPFKYYKKFKKGLSIAYYTGGTSTSGNRRLMVHMISDSAAITHPGFVVGFVAITYEDA